MEWQRFQELRLPIKLLKKNREVANQLGAIVVVKSHRTQVYVDNQVYENPGGTPAQATGGMGDTLAGMIGGFTAQFNNKSEAVLAAVYTHSAIADELAKKSSTSFCPIRLVKPYQPLCCNIRVRTKPNRDFLLRRISRLGTVPTGAYMQPPV